jgi:oligosaccharide repeat unit polymerase
MQASPPPGFAGDLATAGTAVVLALAASVAELPATPVALYVCGSSLVVLGFSISRRPRSVGHIVLAAAFTFWYALPGLLALSSDPSRLALLPEPTTDEDLLRAVQALSLFQFCSLLAIHWCARRGGGPWIETPGAYRHLPAVLCGSFLIGLAPYATLGGGFSATLAAVLESRAVEKAWVSTTQLGNEISAFTAVTSSFLISASMLLLTWAQCSPLPRAARAAFLGVGLLGAALMYFDQGTRSVFALIVIPPAVVAFRRLFANAPRRAIALATIGAGILALLLQFQMLYRATWTRDSLRESLLTDALTMQGTTDFFSETVYAAHLVPGQRDYFRESVLLQFLIGPIPRFLWPEKPVFEMVWFYSNRRANVDIFEVGGNVLPGVVAQQYMSWGLGGVALTALMMGWFAAAIDRRIAAQPQGSGGRTPEEAVLLMMLVWLAISYRLLSPGFLYPVILAFALLKVAGALGGRDGSLQES